MTISKHPVTLKYRKSPHKSPLHNPYSSRIRLKMMTAKGNQKKTKMKMTTTMRMTSSFMRTLQRTLAAKTPSKNSSSSSKRPRKGRGNKTRQEITMLKISSLAMIKRSVWRSHQANKEIKSWTCTEAIHQKVTVLNSFSRVRTQHFAGKTHNSFTINSSSLLRQISGRLPKLLK